MYLQEKRSENTFICGDKKMFAFSLGINCLASEKLFLSYGPEL